MSNDTAAEPKEVKAPVLEKSTKSLEGKLSIGYFLLAVGVIAFILYTGNDDGLSDAMRAKLLDKALTLEINPTFTRLLEIKDMFKKPPVIDMEMALGIFAILVPSVGQSSYFAKLRSSLKKTAIAAVSK